MRESRPPLTPTLSPFVKTNGERGTRSASLLLAPYLSDVRRRPTGGGAWQTLLTGGTGSPLPVALFQRERGEG